MSALAHRLAGHPPYPYATVSTFGYLLGSYRRASIGIDAGYWYTPYRFWAEPERGLRGFTCIR